VAGPSRRREDFALDERNYAGAKQNFIRKNLRSSDRSISTVDTLRDWYRYLERQMHVSFSEPQNASSGARRTVTNSDPVSLWLLHEAPSPAGSPSFNASPAEPAPPRDEPGEAGAHAGRVAEREPDVGEQSTLPIELGPSLRRGGRRRITETRQEIIRRLLDPEVTLYEAAAVLNLSKATVRRYTDQGKLPCVRTGGGQRRFRLSALLTFLERPGRARARP
jgi:excisionase family DNA binding protein